MKESDLLDRLRRRKPGAAARKAEPDGQSGEIRLDASTTFIPGRPTPLSAAEKAAGVTIPNYWRERNRPGRL